jgi:hypothetical protein
MKEKIMRLIILCFCFSLTLFAADKEKSEKGDFWDRTRGATKKIVGGVKQGGKAIGRGVQEVFDPDDEDLQEDRKKKKKKKNNDDDDKD